MYLATQSIHDPLEVPKEYEDLYPHSEIDSQLRTVTDSNLEKGQYCQYRISKIHNEVKIFINPHVDF